MHEWLDNNENNLVKGNRRTNFDSNKGVGSGFSGGASPGVSPGASPAVSAISDYTLTYQE